MEQKTPVRLTEYSHGAGCGCKLSPKVLSAILQQNVSSSITFDRLLVGNDTSDDAAVLDMGNGTGLVSTTDFFMPIVDDPFLFGCIAATNAISDVYAMGGKPILAIGILGWPIDKLSPAIAAEVIHGARSICDQAGIPLAGGHSIDTPEPIFGLAVSGIVKLAHLKRNSTAQPGDALLLTKPLGIGLVTTAHKRSVARYADLDAAVRWMTTLNCIGAELGALEAVTAMTDVTGFGLLGHLCEIAQASNVQIHIDYTAVPVLACTNRYIEAGAIPGGTLRNWLSYGDAVALEGETLPAIANSSERQRYERFKPILAMLCDPQTSGGLAVCYTPNSSVEIELARLFADHGLADFARPIGSCHARIEGEPYIIVENLHPMIN